MKKIAADRNYRALKKTANAASAPSHRENYTEYGPPGAGGNALPLSGAMGSADLAGHIGDQHKVRLKDLYDSLASLKGDIATQVQEDPRFARWALTHAKSQSYLAEALSAIQSAHMEYWPGEWK